MKNPVISSRIKDLVGVLTRLVAHKPTRAVCLLGALLGETSAEGLVDLRYDEAMRRIRKVYGKTYGDSLAEGLGAKLAGMFPSGDVPCLSGRGGRVLSRVTLWRRVGKIGLVGLRRLSLAFRKFFMDHCETKAEAISCQVESGFVVGTPTTWARIYGWWSDAPVWSGRIRRFV
jgi:hypothetical protein